MVKRSELIEIRQNILDWIGAIQIQTIILNIKFIEV